MNDAGYVQYKPLFAKVFGSRVGLEFSRVGLGTTPYLDRYIAYVWLGTLRLHKFWRGDDDRAPHCHPFHFITIPMRSYRELVERPDGARYINIVRAFLPQFRRASYRHIVLGRLDGSPKPFWTFVVASRPVRQWGFWPKFDVFVPWREWR
jgi:hypothetical protein